MTDTLTKPITSRVPFDLGRVLITPAAIDALHDACVGPTGLLRRHVSGDWGDVCPSDADANEAALVDDERLFSVYNLPTGRRVWIITEWDRSATTILLPEDY